MAQDEAAGRVPAKKSKVGRIRLSNYLICRSAKKAVGNTHPSDTDFKNISLPPIYISNGTPDRSGWEAGQRVPAKRSKSETNPP